MNKKLAFAILTSCIIGCSEKSPEHDSTLETKSTTPVESAAVISDADTIQTPVTTPATTVSQSKMQSPQSTPVLAGMNPPHGQPNHRCDIAVGAPLNSPVGKPAATSNVADVKPQMTTTSTAQQPKIQPLHDPAMKGKANPAHGQPGHDCAIAVGQILD